MSKSPLSQPSSNRYHGARRNVLVMQSGGNTPVFNSSLMGVVLEAEASSIIEKVYGALHGLGGVLSEQFVTLSGRSKRWWRHIAQTPAGALGSSRRKFKDDDIPKIERMLKQYNIGYWFIIGGNDSAETGNRISEEALDNHWDLSVINVPKTIDNDLVLTDHCPGYGSAARFVALATMGAGRDAEAMGSESPISVIEVMGRDAGWLAASSALAKREERDAPHVICIPEAPVDEQQFLNRIEDAYRSFGFAVAVVAENARAQNGVLGDNKDPWYVDDFGHAYHEGAGKYLAALAGHQFEVRIRYERPGTIQRSLAATISASDAAEAEMAGRAAVRHALEGQTGQMVTLLRQDEDEYACTTGLTPLRDVAGKVRTLPNEYFRPSDSMPSQAFVEYCTPLIGTTLPRFERIQ